MTRGPSHTEAAIQGVLIEMNDVGVCFPTFTELGRHITNNAGKLVVLTEQLLLYGAASGVAAYDMHTLHFVHLDEVYRDQCDLRRVLPDGLRPAPRRSPQIHDTPLLGQHVVLVLYLQQLEGSPAPKLHEPSLAHIGVCVVAHEPRFLPVREGAPYDYAPGYQHIYIGMRLELVLAEKMMNNVIFNTKRVATAAPTKWNRVNPHEHHKLQYFFMKRTKLGYIFAYFLEWLNFVVFKYQLPYVYERGLTGEDLFIMDNGQMRRSVWYEHMLRTCFHPYHWLLKVHRRERFHRIHNHVVGFIVPEYISNEAKTQSYLDAWKVKLQYDNYLYENFFSDLTPTIHAHVHDIFFPLNFVLLIGFFRHRTWDRFFFNEHPIRTAVQYSNKALKFTYERKYCPINLTSEYHRKRFEERIISLNKQCPGVLCAYGRDFDFPAYYKEIGITV